MPSLEWHLEMLASPLPSACKVILSRMALYQRDNPEAWPKIATIASACGLSYRHTRRLLSVADKFGWLEKKKTPGRYSVYTLTLPARMKTNQTPAILGQGNSVTPDTYGQGSPDTYGLPPPSHTLGSMKYSSEKEGGMGTLAGCSTQQGEGSASLQANPPFFIDSLQSQEEARCVKSEGSPIESHPEIQRGQQASAEALSREVAIWLAILPDLPSDDALWLSGQAKLSTAGHLPYPSTLNKIKALKDKAKDAQLNRWDVELSEALLSFGIKLAPHAAGQAILRARAGNFRIPFRRDLSHPPWLVALGYWQWVTAGDSWIPDGAKGYLAKLNTSGGFPRDLPGAGSNASGPNFPCQNSGGILYSGDSPRDSLGGGVQESGPPPRGVLFRVIRGEKLTQQRREG